MQGLIAKLASLTPERFQEIVLASPKKYREEVFRRAGVKKRASNFSITPSGDEGRVLKLQESLRAGEPPGGEHIEALVRNYLYGRRNLLAAALDFLGVPHEGGLTDQDLDFLESIPEERGRALRQQLLSSFSAGDVDLYLEFMKIPGSLDGEGSDPK